MIEKQNFRFATSLFELTKHTKILWVTDNIPTTYDPQIGTKLSAKENRKNCFCFSRKLQTFSVKLSDWKVGNRKIAYSIDTVNSV
jgi:hypothetical protein